MQFILKFVLAFLCFSSAHAGQAAKNKSFSAKSFIVADASGVALYEKNSDIVRPIASISKLMVALLASEQDMYEALSVPKKRFVQSSIPRKVESLSRRSLLELALIKSDNLAAQILCNNITDCVIKMNARAYDIGMYNTKYVEPTGLDSNNVSTAQDLIKLVLATIDNKMLSEISSMPDARITTSYSDIRIRNTNPLTSKMDVILSKTGFTNVAGQCLVMVVRSDVSKRIFVLLGSKRRVADVLILVKYQ